MRIVKGDWYWGFEWPLTAPVYCDQDPCNPSNKQTNVLFYDNWYLNANIVSELLFRVFFILSVQYNKRADCVKLATHQLILGLSVGPICDHIFMIPDRSASKGGPTLAAESKQTGKNHEPDVAYLWNHHCEIVPINHRCVDSWSGQITLKNHLKLW